jgi:kinetochore protein Spc7/SPC105
MEFTSVVGGVLSGVDKPNQTLPSTPPSMSKPPNFFRQSPENSLAIDEEDMDMTAAVGGILLNTKDDATVAMDMTTAIGGILQGPQPNRSEAKALMERECDATDLASPCLQAPRGSPLKPSIAHTTTVDSETGSPNPSKRSTRGSRRSTDARLSVTPKSKCRESGTPIKKSITPTKQSTPLPPRPTTPGKTPPSKNVTMRSVSPKRLFEKEIRFAASTTDASITEEKTLKQQPQKETKISVQDDNTASREDVESHEPEIVDATLNMKKMIESLTPKKKVNGRKSLHVGAAKGLLGKRPAELDEEDDDNDTKRLKELKQSPVKTVKISALATKVEAPSTSPTPLEHSEDNSASMEESVEDDRIHLQDFLNLTSIRFMELTTTKRRHTAAPKFPKGELDKMPKENDEIMGSDSNHISLECCVVTSACIVPMLELYQHVRVTGGAIQKLC